jgi:hypothetical protein
MLRSLGTAEQAIIQVVDSLVMALGGIERRLDFLSETPLSGGRFRPAVAAAAPNGGCANLCHAARNRVSFK